MLNLTVWRWVKTIAEMKCFTCWNWVFWFIKMKQNDSCNFFLISSLPKPACACEMFVLVRDAASLGNFSACSVKQPVAADSWLSWLLLVVLAVRPFFPVSLCRDRSCCHSKRWFSCLFCFTTVLIFNLLAREQFKKISISVSCSLLLSGFAPRTLVCRVLAASRVALLDAVVVQIVMTS